MIMWEVFLNHIGDTISALASTAGLFWENIVSGVTLIGIIDTLLVFGLLWWIYKRLRRSELIRIFPRVLILLIIMLLSKMLGMLALFYVSAFILVIVLLAIGVLYAPEVKNVLEMPVIKMFNQVRPNRFVPTDIQKTIKALGEALAVLSRARKLALIIIKKDKSLARLLENSTKMNSRVRSDLLIDFFANGSVLGKGAVIIDGNKIVGAGSTLFKKDAKVLFNINDRLVRKVAKDLGAVVIVANKAAGDINVIHNDDVYKNLSPQDLVRVLQTIFIYQK
ncbi:hypothetical protein DRH29_00480 [candidate division Kazan bacterium]|uniref:DAC domain-containing protein n=1 Tax=candidate division Kazan bacterium TaxID=2202143 RepID=A0A420ZDQ5_UNCK3|nr:MAG: hypothetical protein DRH29_00480 [candidate division Kazan bacterium]